MNEMLDRLEHAQDRQRRFVADASHELRTPVASIRQHAEVALAHPEHSGLRSLAETVLAEVLRMQRLVSDLLVLAASDERSAMLRSRPVDLDDLVFAVAADLRASSTLRVDTTAVSASVIGDGPALRRVLTNLVENAARHACTSVGFALTTVDDTVILIETTTVPEYPNRTAGASWNASSAWTPPEPATPAAADSAWPSSPRSCMPTAATSRSVRTRSEEPASRSGCHLTPTPPSKPPRPEPLPLHRRAHRSDCCKLRRSPFPSHQA